MTEVRGAARVGDYELIDRFALGGASEIFRARDTRTADIVVIKRLRPELVDNGEVMRGFEREIELACMFRHRNLIRGLHRGVFQGRRFGVLEYADGQDLAAVLDRARAFGIEIPLSFATYIVNEILQGLHVAHELRSPTGEAMGLVHRDLSPRNIIVRYDGEIRVADFGSSIASAFEDPRRVVGSPGYMSPEQARGAPLDRRSDLFAVGLLLHELVAGRPAFDIRGLDDARVLRLHEKGETAVIPARVPESIRFVIEIACSPLPDDRYPSAQHMRAALIASDVPPDPWSSLGVATLVRALYRDEFQRTRLVGTPLSF